MARDSKTAASDKITKPGLVLAVYSTVLIWLTLLKVYQTTVFRQRADYSVLAPPIYRENCWTTTWAWEIIKLPAYKLRVARTFICIPELEDKGTLGDPLSCRRKYSCDPCSLSPPSSKSPFERVYITAHPFLSFLASSPITPFFFIAFLNAPLAALSAFFFAASISTGTESFKPGRSCVLSHNWGVIRTSSIAKPHFLLFFSPFRRARP